MFLVEGMQGETGLHGNLGDYGVQNADTMAQYLIPSHRYRR
jgi:FPC/CPF motif-containing protein YcgG